MAGLITASCQREMPADHGVPVGNGSPRSPTPTEIGRGRSPESLDSELPRPSQLAEPARIVRVVDGDTVDATLERTKGTVRVRLIGVDTPEKVDPRKPVQCFAEEASRFTEQLEGALVLLDYDVERYDRYGRTLAYVFLQDGRLFNLVLVREGYAQPYTVPPNVRYQELFVQAAARAREEGRGLWRACS